MFFQLLFFSGDAKLCFGWWVNYRFRLWCSYCDVLGNIKKILYSSAPRDELRYVSHKVGYLRISLRFFFEFSVYFKSTGCNWGKDRNFSSFRIWATLAVTVAYGWAGPLLRVSGKVTSALHIPCFAGVSRTLRCSHQILCYLRIWPIRGITVVHSCVRQLGSLMARPRQVSQVFKRISFCR